MTPGAERLRQHEHLPGSPARVREHARGVDEAGDGVAELDLRVAHGVAAEERAARLGERRGAARARSRPPTPTGKSRSGNAAIESAVIGRPPIA